MSENFDDFNNEEYSESEYEEVFFDSLVDAMMNVFEILKANEPDLAKSCELDYQEFMKNLVEYFKQHKTVDGSLNYILSKSPNNLWAEIITFIGMLQLKEYQDNPEREKRYYEEIFKYLETLIKKRREGKHFQ